MKKFIYNFTNKFKSLFSKSSKHITTYSNGCGCYWFEDNL